MLSSKKTFRNVSSSSTTTYTTRTTRTNTSRTTNSFHRSAALSSLATTNTSSTNHHLTNTNYINSFHNSIHKSFFASLAASAATTEEETLHKRTTDNDIIHNKNKNIKPFILTDIGEGITEVELIQWYIQPNDKIEQFDNVCQVQSDKATVDITSRYDGVVHSLNGCDVGDMIKVGTPLLFIRVDDDDDNDDDDDDDSYDVEDTFVERGNGKKETVVSTTVPTTPSIDNPILSSSQPTFQKRNQEDDTLLSVTSSLSSSSSSSSNEKFLATPAVRKLIKEYDVDVSSMRGTGPNGRILKGDVLNILGLNGNSSTSRSSSSANISGEEDYSYNGVVEEDIIIQQQQQQPQDTISSLSSSNEDIIVPIRGYHRLMVNSMTSTLQVPHMTYSDEVEMTNLMKMRNDLNEMLMQQQKKQNQQQQLSSKVSFLPFMIKACSLAIKEYPILNSSIDVDEMNITYHSRHDIGIAMDSDRGLVVPVVRGCENLSILEIAFELDQLRELAMNGGLTEKHLINPTFTLSNIGSIGGTIMSPVVLPPQVAIGAMGKIQRLPRFVNDSSMDVAEYHIMNISWGGDHRVIDGATLGRFSNTWKSYIETPMKMAFSMK